MGKTIAERARVRLKEDFVSADVLDEYISTATDRICLRLGVDELPKAFESIAVDVVVKMHRRSYYEGVSSESADTLSTSFVDDILNEYSDEFQSYKNQMRNADSLKVVSFL